MITGFMIIISCAVGNHEAKPKKGLELNYETQAQCEQDALKLSMDQFNLNFTGECHAICTEIVEGEQ